MTEKLDIHGYCDQDFSAVRDVFAKNFESGSEVGASVAVTINREYVVDIWAGYSDAAPMDPPSHRTRLNGGKNFFQYDHPRLF